MGRPGLDELRRMFLTAEELRHTAVIAAADANAAAAAFNCAMARELADRRALPGAEIDLWGDGSLKPAKDLQMPPGGGEAPPEPTPATVGLAARPKGRP